MSHSSVVHAIVSSASLLAWGCIASHETIAPTDLQVTGSLRNMHLSWTGSAAGSYDVHRSADGAEFVRINAAPVAATSYDDRIESPAGDGVRYSYRVTAAGDAGADVSNVAGAIHGTRLAASYAASFSTRTEDSPYVMEHTTTQVDGDLWVSPGTRLYVLEDATIDFRGDGHRLLVDGELRAVGSASAPAAFTAHRRDGGYLAVGEGFQFVFAGPPYNAVDQSGSLLDHVRVTNAAPSWRANLAGPLNVIGTGVALHHVKLMVNGSYALSRQDSNAMVLANGGWVVIRNCSFEDLLLDITTDMRDTPFEVSQSVFRGGHFAIMFDHVESPAVRPGQIDSNDLDGELFLRLNEVTGTAEIPLGHNYWGDDPAPRLPHLYATGSTAAVSFDEPGGVLGVPPPGAGPDW